MELQTTLEKGTGVFATRNYQVGNIILSEEAYAFVTLQDSSLSVCHACFRSGHSLKTCSRCKFAKYCGKYCQRKAWNDCSHRWECKAVASLREKKIPSIVRLTALVLFRACSPNNRNEKLLNRCRKAPYVCSTVPERLDYLVEKLRCFMKLSDYPEKNILESLEDTFLASFIHMLEMNAHTVYDSEFNTVGVGFFYKASFMNHDCRPNCVALFSGGFQSVSITSVSIQIRCVRPIDAGEEIVISYLDVCLSWLDRSEWLLEHYMFTCCCSRCKEEQCSENWTDLKQDWKVINQFTAISVQEERVNKNMLNSYENMKKAWKKCQQCMKTYPNCAIFDWKRIEIVSRLGYLCIVLEKYSEATEYLELYMDWMKKKPEFANFPTVALEMLKLGKLYAYLGKLKQAKYYLEKAKQIYEKLLVREDPIYRTCEEELSKVMAEYEWVMQQKDQLGVI